MRTTIQPGIGFIALAALAMSVAASTVPRQDTANHAKTYALAVSVWSRLHLIELGTDWPTKVRHADDQLMYCRHVVRLFSFEIGARCAPEATAIADAGI